MVVVVDNLEWELYCIEKKKIELDLYFLDFLYWLQHFHFQLKNIAPLEDMKRSV